MCRGFFGLDSELLYGVVDPHSGDGCMTELGSAGAFEWLSVAGKPRRDALFDSFRVNKVGKQ